MSQWSRAGARSGRRTGTATVIAGILLLAIAPALAGQAPGKVRSPVVTTLPIGDRPSCPRCTVRLEPVARLGDAEGEGLLPSRPYDIAIDARGRFVVVVPERGEEPPLLFTAAGRYAGRLGRVGDGPGEYRQPAAVESRGDTLVIIDKQAGRLTATDLDGRVRWTAPIPAGANTAAWLDGDRVAINARVRGAAGAGAPVHLLDTRGRYLRALASAATAADPRVVTRDVRWLVPLPGGGLLSIDYSHRYRAELWSPDFASVRVVTRAPAWFPSFERPWNPTPARPPMARAMGGWVEGDRLWLVFHVPSRTWARGLGRARRGEGGAPYHPIDDQQLAYRTMLDVIDLRRGALEASAEVEGTVDLVIAAGVVGLVREDAEGRVVVRVMRVRLRE